MIDEAAPGIGDERTDAALLRAVADGDRGALHELFGRHEPWLAARLSGRCGDKSLVDEAISDTFLAVWRRPRAWRGEIAAWLWGIAIRARLHYLRPGRNVVERLIRLRPDDSTTPEELQGCRSSSWPRRRSRRCCSAATGRRTPASAASSP